MEFYKYETQWSTSMSVFSSSLLSLPDQHKKIHILAWRKTIHSDKNPHMPDRLENQANVYGGCSCTEVKWQV